MEAARLLARGDLDLSNEDDDAADDLDAALAAFGLVLDRSAEGRRKPFYLLPENRAALDAWLQVQTQWRIGGMGTPTGLDYAGIEAWMRCTGRAGNPRRARRLLQDLQLMERVTLNEWADRAQRDSARSRR